MVRLSDYGFWKYVQEEEESFSPITDQVRHCCIDNLLLSVAYLQASHISALDGLKNELSEVKNQLDETKINLENTQVLNCYCPVSLNNFI